MNRTISTACIALSSCLDPPHNIPIICLPEIQNLDSGVNGQGMDFEDLKIAYSVGPVDITSFGREGWNEKSLGSGWDSQEMPWRVDYMRGFLRGLWAGSGMKRTVEVVVVSHGSFLRGFVKDGELARICFHEMADKCGQSDSRTSCLVLMSWMIRNLVDSGRLRRRSWLL